LLPCLLSCRSGPAEPSRNAFGPQNRFHTAIINKAPCPVLNEADSALKKQDAFLKKSDIVGTPSKQADNSKISENYEIILYISVFCVIMR
jgi:hypothetical protein